MHRITCRLVMFCAATSLQSQAVQATQATFNQLSAHRAAKVSLVLNNVSVEQALIKIKHRSGVRIAYAHAVTAEPKRVSLVANDLLVTDVVARVLSGTALRYQVLADGQIL